MSYRFSPERLRQARVRSGKTPESLAVAAGRSLSSLHFYESGRVSPPIPVVLRLAEALDVSPADLFEEVERVAS